mmetsp:Transcript_56336/g.142494  ORF Transcript_56336/g.142494 Transcript_56336/m.142494 type:complete len:423 (+) Transcript_56336:261-1529(+)
MGRLRHHLRLPAPRWRILRVLGGQVRAEACDAVDDLAHARHDSFAGLLAVVLVLRRYVGMVRFSDAFGIEGLAGLERWWRAVDCGSVHQRDFPPRDAGLQSFVDLGERRLRRVDRRRHRRLHHRKQPQQGGHVGMGMAAAIPHLARTGQPPHFLPPVPGRDGGLRGSREGGRGEEGKRCGSRDGGGILRRERGSRDGHHAGVAGQPQARIARGVAGHGGDWSPLVCAAGLWGPVHPAVAKAPLERGHVLGDARLLHPYSSGDVRWDARGLLGRLQGAHLGPEPGLHRFASATLLLVGACAAPAGHPLSLHGPDHLGVHARAHDFGVPVGGGALPRQGARHRCVHCLQHRHRHLRWLGAGALGSRQQGDLAQGPRFRPGGLHALRGRFVLRCRGLEPLARAAGALAAHAHPRRPILIERRGAT